MDEQFLPNLTVHDASQLALKRIIRVQHTLFERQEKICSMEYILVLEWRKLHVISQGNTHQ